MGTKTIGVTEAVYERLAARKRADESFTDLLDRLLDEATADWREGFGTLPDDAAADLERIAREGRAALAAGLADRQTGALTAMADEDVDEAP